MSKSNYDFRGWATVYNRKCSDGRTIRPGAFADCDGADIPLVWNHMHNDPAMVIGNAHLEHRDQGVYFYGSFNENQKAKDAKNGLVHGDFKSVSIYANKLTEKSGDVYHGTIRELSLVLAGANPDAKIDEVLCHGDEEPEEAIIYNGEEDALELYHAEEESEEGEIKMAEEKTIQQVFDEMTEEQKTVVYALVGQAVEDAKNEGGNADMKHNVFDEETYGNEDSYISHAETEEIFADATRGSGRSLKETVLEHGIENLDYMIPDAKSVTQNPIWINEDNTWVANVMSRIHRTPFARIKSIFADITADEARAKGYITGNYKKEEVFTLLQRETNPTTVYKKQAFDRDTIVDVANNWDAVAEVKKEMRMKLDEELARAILISDGRKPSSKDKIKEDNIRPIWKDEDLFTIKAPVILAAGSTSDQRAKAFIRTAIKSRKKYKGSGNPVLYTTEDVLTDCLLMEDSMGRVIYDSEEKLRTVLRVSAIVTVPVMENQVRIDDGKTYELMGIIVNLNDYNIGADKGGAVSLFDDFDIDYNKMKYLIETRVSGALTVPHSAIAIELTEALMHTVDAESPSTTVLGKLVGDLQEDVLVHDKFIEGTLPYVDDFTGYSGDPAEQKGHFLVLKFTATEGATTTVELTGGPRGPVELDSDMQAVFRITSKNQKIKVVTTLDGASVETVYDLRSLTLESEA